MVLEHQSCVVPRCISSSPIQEELGFQHFILGAIFILTIEKLANAENDLFLQASPRSLLIYYPVNLGVQYFQRARS